MTNIRAIDQIIDAQQSLSVNPLVEHPSVGITFANELIRHLEAGKPGVVTMGEMSFDFDPAEVTVDGTNVHFGSFEVSLEEIIAHDATPYGIVILVDEVNLLGETVALTLRAA